MFVETVKSEGLAHLGYVVGNGREAIVIDTRRDVDAILDIARRRGVRIVHILETHRNEDYVIGSRELREHTGAEISHGATLDFGYGRAAQEGDQFEAGSIRLKALETPGHTQESLSYVLYDTSTGDSPLAVFTGDVLFVGDVGRTDLMGDGERAANLLFDSLHQKLLPLGDHVIVYPAHGAGSVCGEAMADRDFSTIGYERTHNPLLSLDREAFVAKKRAERHVQPPYFKEMEAQNRDGPPVLRGLPDPEPLGPAELEEKVNAGARVIDVRSAEAFVGASIPGALSLPLTVLSAYAGWFIDPDRDLVLVAEDRAHVESAVRQLVRIGRARVVGWLASGMQSWEVSGRPLRRLGVTHVEELEVRAREQPSTIIDVRKDSEWESGHFPGAIHVFLGDLPKKLGVGDLPSGRLTMVCGSGQRATVAASLLAAENREVDVALGPMKAVRQGYRADSSALR